MTPQEYQALVTILQRAPISPAEALWLEVFIPTLAPAQPGPESAAVKATEPDSTGGAPES